MSAVDDALRVQVSRTAQDYRSAIFETSLKRGAWKGLGIVGVIAAGFVFVSGVSVESPSVLSDSALAGVIATLAAAGLFALMLLSTATRASRLPGALGPISYAFTFSGVAVESPTGKSETKWQNWAHAIETKDLFILLSRAGAAHVLPKRELDADMQMRLRILFNEMLGGERALFVESRA